MLFDLSFPLLETPVLRETIWRSLLSTVLRNGRVGVVYPEGAGGRAGISCGRGNFNGACA